MSDEEIIGKIKKGAEKSEDAIEKGAKKGWESVKDFGKDVKDSVTKMVKKGGKK
jgi:hypothetical protein